MAVAENIRTRNVDEAQRRLRSAINVSGITGKTKESLLHDIDFLGGLAVIALTPRDPYVDPGPYAVGGDRV